MKTVSLAEALKELDFRKAQIEVSEEENKSLRESIADLQKALQEFATITEGGEEFYPILGEKGAKIADEALDRLKASGNYKEGK